MKAASIVIPFIPGDGIGPEIMGAAQSVVNQAVTQAYHETREIKWKPALAGQQAYNQTGSYLPNETLRIFEKYPTGLKGPLTTPIGGGFRSLNVQIRQSLDLYACVRLIRWFEGLPSPHRNPEGIDIAVFRENTEDIYIGIEYEASSKEHKRFLEGFQKSQPEDYNRIPTPSACGIGIKPISKNGSQRLVQASLDWALKNNRKRVTLVHKGNIMKYTEGAFRNWGYDTAETDYSKSVFTRRMYTKIKNEESIDQAKERKQNALEEGKLWVDDVIADVVFEQLITRPQEFDVLATTNLNGDYLSDASAALAGGVGISPGGNINYHKGTAIFEANHGSAEDLAGKNKANPSSLILSAEMMLRYIGWTEAATLIWAGIQKTIREKTVTFDLARQIVGAQAIGTKEFAQAITKTF
jgi:isocitrate dehydrogenase